ncbi:MAG: hypothetical protein Q4G65_03635 [bacterium]|nr:hypothetical protein [bacterium]
MFLVSDGRDKRKQTIARHAIDDLAVGVILAAIDFEWTCRRCILALGYEPTMRMKEEFVDQKWFGRELKVAWQEKVQRGNHKSICSLSEVFDKWAKENCGCYVVWQDVMHAFDIRNKIVHGATGTVSVQDGRTCINVFEVACDVLCEYVITAGGFDSRSIFKRIVRYKGTGDAVEVAKPSIKKQKEKKFAGASSDEILVEGVRLRVANMDRITGGKVRPSLARKLFVSMRPFFKEW